MHAPIIGITTSYSDNLQRVDHRHVIAIERAGGIPVIVPMLTESDDERLRALACLLDGLVMTGGPGITINLIGTLPDGLPPVHPIRARADDAIFDALRGRPMLGVCYGMQFMNVKLGGALYADVQHQQPGAAAHSSDRGATTHPVQIVPDTRLHAITGANEALTNSYHYQAVAQVALGLRASAISADGVVEAIESHDGLYVGLQFHPELMLETMQPVYDDLVARCRAAG
jgi:putative glutamine amidotransferase